MGITTKIIDFIKALFDKTNDEEQIVVEEKTMRCLSMKL